MLWIDSHGTGLDRLLLLDSFTLVRETFHISHRSRLRARSAQCKVGHGTPNVIHLGPDAIGARRDLAPLDIGTSVAKQKVWSTRIGILTNPIGTLIQLYSHGVVRIATGDHCFNVGLATGWRIGNGHIIAQGDNQGVRVGIE